VRCKQRAREHLLVCEGTHSIHLSAFRFGACHMNAGVCGKARMPASSWWATYGDEWTKMRERICCADQAESKRAGLPTDIGDESEESVRFVKRLWDTENTLSINHTHTAPHTTAASQRGSHTSTRTHHHSQHIYKRRDARHGRVGHAAGV
jgi:hypothetical protein